MTALHTIHTLFLFCIVHPVAWGSPTDHEIIPITTPRSDAVCRAEGYFPNTKDCKKFYRCVKIQNGGETKFTKHDFECAPGTSFDTTTSNCNFDHEVQCTAPPSGTPGIPAAVGSPGSGSEAAAGGSSEANECIYELNLGYRNGTPDGTFKRMANFNGQFPGPTLTCELGKFLVVRVNNLIDEPTSVHWHGIEQNLSPFYDGPESVTQCPIVPGTSMLYRFQLFQAGTYWYHSHHSHQYVDGAWGSLIIANKKPRGEVWRDLYDDELIITLNDWHHLSAEELGDGYLNGTSGLPVPDSILINGLGSSNCKTTTQNDRDCYPNLDDQKPAVVSVVPGTRYRIRVINTSATSSFNFSIDGHKLQTIETDGVDTLIVSPVDVVQIWTAQRYSFLLTANRPLNEYWIRAIGDIGKVRALAVLKYNRDSTSKPVSAAGASGSANQGNQGRPAVQTFDWTRISSERACGKSFRNNNLPSEMFPLNRIELKPSASASAFSRAEDTNITLPGTSPPRFQELLNQDNCRPFHQGAASDAPDYYDRLIEVNATFCGKAGDRKPRFCFNMVQFVPGDTKSLPALFQLIQGEPITNGAATFETPYMNEIVQVVINNQASGNHPWHLHGHTFWVLGTGARGQGFYNATRDQPKLTLKGVRRDTTHGWANSWVVLRYYTGNPGAWLLHCHINWHLTAGLGGVIIEAQALAQQVYCSPPQEVKQVCRRAGVEIA